MNMRTIVLSLWGVVTTLLIPTSASADQLIWYGAGMTVFTIYDVETTFYKVSRNQGQEGNPILRPFVKSGRVATYSYEMSANVLVFLAMRRLKSEHRHWQWLPLTVIGTHTVAGSINLSW